MKLNCKAGDLAILVSSKTNPELVGSIFEVLYMAPLNSPHLLPNGFTSAPSKRQSWVIKSFTGLNLLTTSGPRMETEFCACSDALLRPIRNDPGADETLDWCDVPSEVAA